MHTTSFPPVIVFGAAERGVVGSGVLCRSIHDLYTTFGNPPEESFGLVYALQSLLYKRDTLYFRVEEEGVSVGDYIHGFHVLLQHLQGERPDFPQLGALCLPGVGIDAILLRGVNLCASFHGILVIRPEDLYDYMTEGPTSSSSK